jgi:DNA-binding beta-propeller fold protein YncE
VRQLRTWGVIAVTSAASLIGLCLKFPLSPVRAQNQTSAAPAASAISSRNISASIVATNISSRSLAVAPATAAESASSVPAATALATVPSVLYLNVTGQPSKLFSFAAASSSTAAKASAAAVPDGIPTFSGASIPSNVAQLAVIAGTGISGSSGDGAKATSAEFNLSADALSVRSGIAIAPDGTIYVADTSNATIRSIASPASSEPGIVRSVAGRWAARQNVQLSEPLGIALDRSGNLYIADRAANAVDIFYGSASPKAGQLEAVATFNAPSDVAVTPDGRTVYVSSADTGAVAAINTQTRAVRDAGIVPASLFPASLVKSSAVRVVPQGLSTDGAGNLFVAYALTNSAASSGVAANSDQILRLDAFTAKVTVAARGLSEPGEISFDVAGNLFVSNQSAGQILKFAALGVPATGVSLTPPGGAGTVTDFGDVPVGGSTDASALQSFELSNNTSATLTNVLAATVTGNNSDFTVVNSSCTASLAAGSSCNFNLSFTPTQNALSACGNPITSQERCTNLTVIYSGASSPLTAALTGTADDFSIQCVTTDSVLCLPSQAGGTVSITIPVGYSATYQFQIVPDSVFSGPVTLTCPSNLPAAPVGTTSQPTMCGISAGTSVTEPLVSSLVVNVTPGTNVPFNVTFQTTDSNGHQFPPGGGTTTVEGKRTLVITGLSGTHGGPASPATAQSASVRRATLTLLAFATLVLLSLVSLGFRSRTLRLAAFRENLRARRRALVPIFGFSVLLVIVATVAGCHHYESPAIGNTPQGTYQLTVTGSAQNTSRGFTMTLVVD